MAARPGWGAALAATLCVLAVAELSGTPRLVTDRNSMQSGDWARWITCYAAFVGLVLWQWPRVERLMKEWRFWVVLVVGLLCTYQARLVFGPVLRAVGLTGGRVIDREHVTTRLVKRPPPPVDPASLFEYELPVGWERAEPSSLRIVNLRLPGGGECYVTLGEGDGTLAPNVNRWRGQLGLEPLGADALAALPRQKFFNRDAVRFEGTGVFQGRTDTAMVALIVPDDRMLFTVKLIGATEVVARERANFDRFVASLRMGEQGTGGAEIQPQRNEEPAGGGEPQLQWTLPAGWSRAPDRRMVQAVLRVTADTECTISFVAGGPQSMTLNLDRWREQMGAPPLAPGELDDLPELAVLGARARWMLLTGTFTGHRDGKPREGWAILGLVCPLRDRTVSLKLFGPEATVRAQQAGFLELARSLKM